jgi:hypothetical protein
VSCDFHLANLGSRIIPKLSGTIERTTANAYSIIMIYMILLDWPRTG